MVTYCKFLNSNPSGCSIRDMNRALALRSIASERFDHAPIRRKEPAIVGTLRWLTTSAWPRSTWRETRRGRERDTEGEGERHGGRGRGIEREIGREIKRERERERE